MQTILAWFTGIDVTSWLGVAAAFVLAFDRLAKITPTNSDNAVVEAIQRVFAILGVKVQDNLGNVPAPVAKPKAPLDHH